MRATNTLLNKQKDPTKRIKGNATDNPETRYSMTSFGDFGGNEKFIKTKSILYITLAFLAIAYSSVTFIFSILAYRETSERNWQISQIVQNWKEIPIVAITSTSEKNCPLGFEALASGIWPGTFRGCYCPKEVDEPKIRDTLVKGSCDTIQNQNKCEDVSEENPIYIRRFYPEKLICIQRQGQNIIKTKMVSKIQNLKCPGETRNWGPENTPENQTWVSNKFDCPIIDLKYGKSENETLNKNYTEVKLGNNFSIYYSSTVNDGGLPISEFTLSEGNEEERNVWINLQDSNVPKEK